MSEERFLEYIHKVDEKAAASKQESEDPSTRTLQHFEQRFAALAKDTDDAITKGLNNFDNRM